MAGRAQETVIKRPVPSSCKASIGGSTRQPLKVWEKEKLMGARQNLTARWWGGEKIGERIVRQKVAVGESGNREPERRK